MNDTAHADPICPRGCTDAEDCLATGVSPCPLGRYATDESGRFSPCSHLRAATCRGCGTCTICDGCYCGEE